MVEIADREFESDSRVLGEEKAGDGMGMAWDLSPTESA